MLLLFIVVGLSISVSALCSLTEASLFSVPLPHVKHLADKGSKQGKILLKFKNEIGPPISAVLILNTIANTLGAAMAGAIVSPYGEKVVIGFSIFYTVLILAFSEIVPKQVGTNYARQTAVLVAFPLLVLTRLLRPLIVLTEFIARYVGPGSASPSISEHEVLSMAKLGREEGVLDHLEGSVIRNVVGLDRRLVKDVLTPRVVVFRLEENTKLADLREEIMGWSHTRVPLFPEENPDSISRYVIQRDLFRSLLSGGEEKTLKDMSRPLRTVTEFMRTDKLLLQMFETRESMCSVVDEHGAFAGIVTLEDIMEEIVGREIVDEYDLVSDLRSYAQILHRKRETT